MSEFLQKLRYDKERLRYARTAIVFGDRDGSNEILNRIADGPPITEGFGDDVNREGWQDLNPILVESCRQAFIRDKQLDDEARKRRREAYDEELKRLIEENARRRAMFSQDTK